MSALPTLDPDELIAQARAETGLREFDEPDVVAPLRVLTRALREEARLTPGGQYFWSGRLHGILVARLRGRDWVRRHPEILDEQLPPPVVILGPARTGTTLLHRLLAADPRFYSAAWWECRFPVPADDDVSGEQRRTRGDRRGCRDSRGPARSSRPSTRGTRWARTKTSC